MVGLFQTYVIDQWRMIFIAPTPYIMTGIVLGLLIWAAFNWAYGHRIEKKNETISLLDREIADYKRKLDGASPEQARAKIADLESKIQHLSERLRPRRLTDQQKIDLSNLITCVGVQLIHLHITYDNTCADCHLYAADLAEAIGSAKGWAVDAKVVFSSFIKVASGLAVLVRDRSSPAPEAIILIRAFAALGIAVDVIDHPRMAENRNVALLVVPRTLG